MAVQRMGGYGGLAGVIVERGLSGLTDTGERISHGRVLPCTSYKQNGEPISEVPGFLSAQRVAQSTRLDWPAYRTKRDTPPVVTYYTPLSCLSLLTMDGIRPCSQVPPMAM